MFKNWEMVLYFLTGFWCMILGITGWGEEMSDPLNFMIRGRVQFHLVVMVLLTIVLVRSRKLLKKYDSNYFETTEKILRGSEICFVLVIIVTVFAVAGAIPTFILLPKKVFFEGGAAGLFWLMLFTAMTWALHNVTSNQINKVIKQREEEKYPLSEKLEDFFSFIHSMDEKQEELTAYTEDLPDEMPDASALLDEAFSDGDEVQHIPIIDHVSVPAELWECPICGSLNSNHSEQCDFCGSDRESKLP